MIPRKLNSKALIALVTLLTCSFQLSACSTATSPIELVQDRIENLGPVHLSKERGSVDANQFVSYHANRNQVLWNLVQKQGAPNLIELKKASWEPWKAYLYYPYQEQVWLLRHTGARTFPNTILAGPEALPSSLSRGLASLDRDFGSYRSDKMPVLSIAGTSSSYAQGNFSSSPARLASRNKITESNIEGSKSLATLSNRNAPSLPFSSSNSTSSPVPVTSVVPPTNLARGRADTSKLPTSSQLPGARAQLKAKLPENESQLSSTPDNRFYSVKGAEETLWEISKTETGSGDNFRRIATINSISYPFALTPGQKILIPGYLIKQ